MNRPRRQSTIRLRTTRSPAVRRAARRPRPLVPGAHGRIQARLPRGADIADLGCGPARDAATFAERFGHWTRPLSGNAGHRGGGAAQPRGPGRPDIPATHHREPGWDLVLCGPAPRAAGPDRHGPGGDVAASCGAAATWRWSPPSGTEPGWRPCLTPRTGSAGSSTASPSCCVEQLPAAGLQILDLTSEAESRDWFKVMARAV